MDNSKKILIFLYEGHQVEVAYEFIKKGKYSRDNILPIALGQDTKET